MLNATAQQNSSNSLVNQATGSSVAQTVTQAIKLASARTGVDFSYLLNKASQESGFDPNAKASSSSATGLFQFVDQTWLRMVKNYGPQFGLSHYASQIQIDSNGVAHVSDPKARQAILAMRKDPQISADMAAELDSENNDVLHSNVGGKIGPTELYLAHFLGAGGASDFLNQMKSNPNTKAASVLPDAASANPSVFYNKSGQPRTLAQIYQHFAQKFDNAPTMPSENTALAANSTPSATNYASSLVASANTSGSATNASYLPAVMSGIKSDSSSYFATMVLAQMNTDDMAHMAAFGDEDGSNNDQSTYKKNSVISDLASVG